MTECDGIGWFSLAVLLLGMGYAITGLFVMAWTEDMTGRVEVALPHPLYSVVMLVLLTAWPVTTLWAWFVYALDVRRRARW